MAIPILMLGPGGNYATRYEAVAGGRMRQVRGAQGQPEHPDTESNHSFAGYGGRQRRRQDDGSDEPPRDAGADRPADRFEHTPATDLPIERRGGRRWVKTGSLNAAAQAIAAWIEQQQSTLTQVKMTLISFSTPAEPADHAPSGASGPAALTITAALGPADDHADGPDRRPPAESHQASALMLALADHNEPEADATGMEHNHEHHAEATENPYPYPRLAADPRLFPDDAGTGRRGRRQQGHRLRARRSPREKERITPRSQQGTLFGTYA